jgi:hypothetical protein
MERPVEVEHEEVAGVTQRNRTLAVNKEEVSVWNPNL